MNLDFRCLPTGSLPYEDSRLVKQMMMRLYENVPFLPELPNTSLDENYVSRTLKNIPFVKNNNTDIILKYSPDLIDSKIDDLNEAYNSVNIKHLKKYHSNAHFMKEYLEILEETKPKYTVIRLLGVFSFALLIKNIPIEELLIDRGYRKFLTQSIAVKALWFIKEIKKVSENTTPIILFEEPLLNNFSTLKRNFEDINKDTVVSLLSKIFEKLHENGAKVGVQCFNKCNWQLAIDSNADLISFNAYDNPSNLYVICDKVREFLRRGGYINWAMVPTTSENSIKNLTIDKIHQLYTQAIGELSAKNIGMDLLFRKSLI